MAVVVHRCTVAMGNETGRTAGSVADLEGHCTGHGDYHTVESHRTADLVVEHRTADRTELAVAVGMVAGRSSRRHSHACLPACSWSAVALLSCRRS